MPTRIFFCVIVSQEMREGFLPPLQKCKLQLTPACKLQNTESKYHLPSATTHTLRGNCNTLKIVQAFCKQIIEFSYISQFSAKSWQNPASIGIQWITTIKCQCWQNSARIWQQITKYRKTRLNVLLIFMFLEWSLFVSCSEIILKNLYLYLCTVFFILKNIKYIWPGKNSDHMSGNSPGHVRQLTQMWQPRSIVHS